MKKGTDYSKIVMLLLGIFLVVCGLVWIHPGLLLVMLGSLIIYRWWKEHEGEDEGEV